MIKKLLSLFYREPSVIVIGDKITFVSGGYLIVDATVVGSLNYTSHRVKINSIKNKHSKPFGDIFDEYARNCTKSKLTRNDTYVLMYDDIVIEKTKNIDLSILDLELF